MQEDNDWITLVPESVSKIIENINGVERIRLLSSRDESENTPN